MTYDAVLLYILLALETKIGKSAIVDFVIDACVGGD
jgi:hypothetical protein